MSDGPIASYAALTEYLNWNLGIVLSGIGITGALFGLATAQLGFYIRHYWKDDRLFLRVLVSTVWGLDLFHMGLYTYSLYWFLVFQHNNFAGQQILPWTLYAQTIVNSCLIAVVQTFYCVRVWSLSKRVVTVIALGIVIAATWGLGMVLFAESLMATSVDDLAALKNFSIALSGVTAGTDIIITATLVLLLYTSRSSGSRSKRLVRRLMFYTINTGILTSICALLSLIMIVTKGSTNLYVLFYYVGARLYTIAMLASLNAREGLRNHMAEATGITTIPHIGSVPEHSGSKHLPGRNRKHAPNYYHAAFFGIHRDPVGVDETDMPSKPASSGKARILDSEASGTSGLRRIHTLTLPKR